MRRVTDSRKSKIEFFVGSMHKNQFFNKMQLNELYSNDFFLGLKCLLLWSSLLSLITTFPASVYLTEKTVKSDTVGSCFATVYSP